MIAPGQTRYLRQNLREPLNAGLAIESLEDAGPGCLEPPATRIFGRHPSRTATSAWGALAREGSHHRGPDRNVGAGVEEIRRLSVEARGPG